VSRDVVVLVDDHQNPGICRVPFLTLAFWGVKVTGVLGDDVFSGCRRPTVVVRDTHVYF